MHLTNYSLNKESPNFKLNNELFEINDGTKRTLTSAWKSIIKDGHNKEKIVADIEQLVVNFLASMYPFLNYNYKTAF